MAQPESIATTHFEQQAARERQLVELCTTSPEVVEAQRPALWAAVEAGLATCVDPHAQQAIQLTGHILDWQLFGRADDPLPPGLIEVVDHYRRIAEYDGRYLFSDVCSNSSWQRLRANGCETVVDAVREDILSRQPQLEETLHSIITSSPEYELVQAFNIQSPPTHQEQPLSPFFRSIREAQLREYFERRGIAFDRHTFMVDDETLLQPAQPPHTPNAFAQAQTFFGQLIREKAILDPTVDPTRLGKLIATELHGPMYEQLPGSGVVDEDGNLTGHDASDYIDKAAEGLGQELTETESLLQQWIANRFLDSFMYRLHHDHSANNYGSYVAEVVASTIETFILDFVDELAGALFTRRSLPIVLREPHGEIVPYETNSLRGTAHRAWHDRDGLGFNTREVSDYLHSRRVGDVLQRPENDLQARLILHAQRNPDLPDRSQNEELVLSLYEREFAGNTDPFIPGYRLVSRDRARCGFIREAAGDMYAQADIPLTETQRSALVEAYTTIGMPVLAEAIQTAPTLTVDDLVSHIRQASRYVTPESVRGPYDNHLEGLLPDRIEPNTLADFQALIQNGELQAQCTVSAKFLQLSLELAFGSGSAATASGLLLGHQTAINMAGHAQTILTYQGKQYMLDATPPSDDDNWTTSGYAATGTAPPQQYLADLPPLPIVPPTEVITPDLTEIRRQKLHNLHANFVMRLVGILPVPHTDAVHDRVVRLSANDPLRRTLELSNLARYDQTSLQELTALLTYIKNYRQATASDLKTLHTREHRPETLDILDAQIRQIADYYRVDDT